MRSIHDAWNLSGPAYERSQLSCGIAHLGVGDFVRAHLAVFVDAYVQTHSQDWRFMASDCARPTAT